MTAKKESGDMLFSMQNDTMANVFGIEKGNDLILDAGFPAIDVSFFSGYDYIFKSDYKKRISEIRKRVNDRGGVFNQAHAPFGGGYTYYSTETFKVLPRVLEACGLFGVRNVVVHPLQKGRYYGNEKYLFEINMEFYGKLAKYAKDSGVKIAIENMWQTHPVTGRICDDVCADPEELALYYDTLGDSEAFTVCLDIGHVALCGREPEDAIRILGNKRLGALHVHDVDYLEDCHTLPGTRKINFEKVCLALAEIDYKGDFTLEADSFLLGYPDDFKITALNFMGQTAKYYAGKIEKMRENYLAAKEN